MVRILSFLGTIILVFGALAGGVAAGSGGSAGASTRVGAVPAIAAAGTLGHPAAGRAAHPGWTGERLFGSKNDDDWEPAVAADPSAPYEYILTTRYGGAKACAHCPDPALILRVSNDGGRTFGGDRFLCACKGVVAQNDPQIEVATDGTVYAAWLNDFVPGAVFSKSSDHGRTWTDPITLKTPAIAFGDKPALAISPSGRDVYVAWNASDSYISVSHDFGATFRAPVKTNADTRYWYAYSGAVAANGTVTFSETDYTQDSTGPVRVEALRSTDGGKHWQQVLVDTVAQQPPCVSDGCPLEFYGPSALMAMDATGRLVVMYQGASVPEGPQRVYVRHSTDGGRTWSKRTDIDGGPLGTNAAFGGAAATGHGDFRLWYQDDRNGAAGWNTWFRRSTDGGVTWSAEVRLSDRASGAPYKTAAGYAQPYGDYGEVAITDSGATIAVWGEGTSYNGPGGTWYDLSTP
ncbi:MAG TPA: sialidase family protein [Candidatus Limnocylindrales bacterium]